jgi:DNA processing protein
MASLKYWIWLTTRRGLGLQGTLRLLDAFGDPARVYFADPAEYRQFSQAAQASLLDKSLDRAEEILGLCDSLGIRLLTLQDAQYPERLRNLDDPPLLLYLKGKLFSFDEEVAVGLVGAREATPYGISMAGRLGLELARGGALLVSGIAQGIDAAGLRGALKGGGPVVSVLAGGIDVVYPRENRGLYQDVAAAGVLISEYPPGTLHKGSHFPHRNRLISGLSLGVVAVEGRVASGTLITARLALEQNRDVFAVPGPADGPMSQGTNLLIQRGEAKLVTCAGDILEEYSALYPEKLRRPAPLSPAQQEARLAGPAEQERLEEAPCEKKEIDKGENRAYIDWKDHREKFTEDERDILLALAGGDLGADDLIEATQIPARRVLSGLTLLQVQGMVEERPGRRFHACVLLRMDG